MKYLNIQRGGFKVSFSETPAQNDESLCGPQLVNYKNVTLGESACILRIQTLLYYEVVAVQRHSGKKTGGGYALSPLSVYETEEETMCT